MGVISRWKAKLTAARKRRSVAAAAVKAADKDAAYAGRVIKRHSVSPQRKALAYAASLVGTKEHPAGSNAGPHITDWLRAVNCGPAPWCGAFMHAVLSHAGVKGLTERMRYTPWIVEDARAGRNGLAKVVPWAERRPGDLLLFNWDGGTVDHVGMYVSDAAGAGNVNTIEGNTAVGNDSNGGEVMRRVRNRATIQYVVRPNWP